MRLKISNVATSITLNFAQRKTHTTVAHRFEYTNGTLVDLAQPINLNRQNTQVREAS